MGEIFGAMRRVSLPSDIGLPEARYSSHLFINSFPAFLTLFSFYRILADKQMKEFIPDKVTRSFILMNLHRAVNGV